MKSIQIFIVSAFAVLLSGFSGSSLSPETILAQTGDPVFVGAGDITNCSSTNDEATAKLLDNISGTVFTLGDNAYPDGTLTEFNNCYGPTWGRHKSRTKPAPGNHDYHPAGASGYYTYFGSAASPLDNNCTSNCKGYYSYNLGAWHIIVLNSEISHSAGSAQEQWLRADLAANQNVCTLAYWHKPRFSSGMHGNIASVQTLWQALYDYGADVVLSGHDHLYERFAPQNPNGQADSSRGIREFVVGTGGSALYPFPTIQPNSQVRNNTTYGVLKLTLHSTSYDWQFVPIAGQTFTDSGSGNCVGSGTNPTATQTRTPTAGPTATRTRTPTAGPTATRTRTPTAGPTATRTRTPTATLTIMHIGDLDATNTSQNNRWTAIVTITMHDANHNPLANATVTGTWSNGASGTASCVTGSNGQCTVNKSDLSKGRSSVTFTINNVTRSNFSYASASNHDPDGGSNGTRIIVARP
ncbi:MAG: Ig-like domain-containing protein [Chloroflexota bacterium]|nr:Ig-like domain-containing protein [Chloroflexota bacterium]